MFRGFSQQSQRAFRTHFANNSTRQFSTRFTAETPSQTTSTPFTSSTRFNSATRTSTTASTTSSTFSTSSSRSQSSQQSNKSQRSQKQQQQQKHDEMTTSNQQSQPRFGQFMSSQAARSAVALMSRYGSVGTLAALSMDTWMLMNYANKADDT